MSSIIPPPQLSLPKRYKEYIGSFKKSSFTLLLNQDSTVFNTQGI